MTEEVVWRLLDRYGIVLGDLLMTITLLGGLYGFINRNNLRSWFSRNRFPGIGGNLEHTHWQGVIFTVSRTEVPMWVIEQVQPVGIGLLITDSSQADGQKIRENARQIGITIIEEEILSDPDDPAEANRKTKKLLQKLHDRGVNDIVIDITGGKTPMSLGAFMAAEEAGSDSIYVSTAYKDNKPDMITAEIKSISQVGP
jgi:hypothetical protein